MNLKTEVTRKQSKPNFPKNEHFLPRDTCRYKCVSEDKKCSFSGKFDVLCFIVTSVLRFALLPYYRRPGNLQDQIGITMLVKTSLTHKHPVTDIHVITER